MPMAVWAECCNLTQHHYTVPYSTSLEMQVSELTGSLKLTNSSHKMWANLPRTRL